MNRYHFNVTINGVKFKVSINANNSVSAYGKVKRTYPMASKITLIRAERVWNRNHDDFESFLSTIEEKYGFNLNNCQWMTAENLNIYWYENGREFSKKQF